MNPTHGQILELLNIYSDMKTTCLNSHLAEILNIVVLQQQGTKILHRKQENAAMNHDGTIWWYDK